MRHVQLKTICDTAVAV